MREEDNVSEGNTPLMTMTTTTMIMMWMRTKAMMMIMMKNDDDSLAGEMMRVVAYWHRFSPSCWVICFIFTVSFAWISASTCILIDLRVLAVEQNYWFFLNQQHTHDSYLFNWIIWPVCELLLVGLLILSIHVPALFIVDHTCRCAYAINSWKILAYAWEFFMRILMFIYLLMEELSGTINPLVHDVPILGTVVLTGLVCATSNIFSVCWILVN